MWFRSEHGWGEDALTLGGHILRQQAIGDKAVVGRILEWGCRMGRGSRLCGAMVGSQSRGGAGVGLRVPSSVTK